jgi:hypothetical protein
VTALVVGVPKEIKDSEKRVLYQDGTLLLIQITRLLK